MDNAHRNGRYGIDAPYVPALMIAGALACIALMVFAHLLQLWVTAAILLALTGVFLHATLNGKFSVWRTLLDGIAWRGDEHVLDVGCGRGAVLLMAAEYVPQGCAVGIDIWNTKDQSGNAMETTRENAVKENVSDRVELHTADMRRLPFENHSFEVVVSNVAIHNISEEEGRDQAIDECWRVLKPGGRMLIADISKSRQYAERLSGLGARVDSRNLGWRMWWGGPWMSTGLVDARKGDVRS